MADRNELDYERNVNREYRKALRDRSEHDKAVNRVLAAEQRSLWNKGFQFSETGNTDDLIAGRVALAEESDGLGPCFYVGPTHIEAEGLLVVSFTAPVASLFFKGRQSPDQASSLVDGRRSFVAGVDDITDYSDDLEDGKSAEVVFPRSAVTAPALEVPKAPGRVVRPKVDTVSPEKMAEPDTGAGGRLDALRGKEAVIAALEAPKTGELGSLLGTLQEDQYDIVTRDPRLPIIVQGNPGAGKTVIALHRAGYLTHPEHGPGERPGQDLPLSRVGVIGPTSDYVSHVLGTPGRIGGSRVTVMSVDGLLANLAGLGSSEGVESVESHESSVSTSDRFALALEHVVGQFKNWPGDWTLAKLVGKLVGDNDDAEEYFVEADPEEGERFADFLRQFSSYEDASQRRQNVGWLAVVGVALGTARQFDFDHLIVDEAQDLSPLVWHVLRSVLRPGGGMSVFGDINQRRNDFSWPNWEKVAVSVPLGRPSNEAGLSADDLATRSNFPIAELVVGYRSTVEIQSFANRVLPSTERSVTALRHGPEPGVTKTSARELAATVVDRIEELVEQFPSGVSAVICPMVDVNDAIGDVLRKRGWRVKAGTRERVRDGRRVALLLPDQARGLEFDGVVVVEPARFPQHEGGMRVLYTSLTRANQVLEVVHSSPLPRELR